MFSKGATETWRRNYPTLWDSFPEEVASELSLGKKGGAGGCCRKNSKKREKEVTEQNRSLKNTTSYELIMCVHWGGIYREGVKVD